MPTAKKRSSALSKELDASFADLLDDGAGIAETVTDYFKSDADKRVDELAARYKKLLAWGIVSKLPESQKTLRETRAGVEAFFFKWYAGDKDGSLVTSITSDVHRLEMFAEDFDKQHATPNGFKSQGAPTTSFDIEHANAVLNAGTATTNAASEVVATATDALNATAHAIETTSKKAPWQVWVGGGLLVGLLVVHEIRKSAEAAKGLVEVNELRKAANAAKQGG